MKHIIFIIIYKENFDKTLTMACYVVFFFHYQTPFFLYWGKATIIISTSSDSFSSNRPKRQIKIWMKKKISLYFTFFISKLSSNWYGYTINFKVSRYVLLHASCLKDGIQNQFWSVLMNQLKASKIWLTIYLVLEFTVGQKF